MTPRKLCSNFNPTLTSMSASQIPARSIARWTTLGNRSRNSLAFVAASSSRQAFPLALSSGEGIYPACPNPVGDWVGTSPFALAVIPSVIESPWLNLRTSIVAGKVSPPPRVSSRTERGICFSLFQPDSFAAPFRLWSRIGLSVFPESSRHP